MSNESTCAGMRVSYERKLRSGEYDVYVFVPYSATPTGEWKAHLGVVRKVYGLRDYHWVGETPWPDSRTTGFKLRRKHAADALYRMRFEENNDAEG